jgi:hypothetical protein
LARLSDAIQWDQAPADGAAGVAMVERYRLADPEAPLGQRVRRALIDAPGYAAVKRRRAVVVNVGRFESRTVRLETLCHAFDGPQESCRLQVTVDSAPVDCRQAAADATAVDSAAPQDPDAVARPLRCTLQLKQGAKRLVVSLPKTRDVIAWVVARQVTPQGLFPATVLSRWTEIDQDRPLSTWVAGPTILRITARADAGQLRRLTASVQPATGPGSSQEHGWELVSDSEEYTRRYPSGTALSKPTRHYVTIRAPGPHRLVVASPRGRALVRVEAARAVGLPRERLADAAAPADGTVAAGAMAAGPWPLGVVGWDPEPGAFSLSANLAVVAGELVEGDHDPTEDYLQLGLHLRRELLADQLWIRATALGRARAGPSSQGAEVHLSMAARTGLPGAFTQARVITQRFGGAQAVGAHAVAGALYVVPLSHNLRLVPLAQLSLRRVDDAGRGEEAADRTVYSPYAATHPRSLDVALRADYRPYVDTLTRAGARLRFAPDFDGVDRIEVYGRGQLLAGTGLAPWTRLDAVISYRPVCPQRTQAFVRAVVGPSVTFWHWVHDWHRLTASAALSYLHDFPEWVGRGSEISGKLVLGYDLVFGRGMRDHALYERPFRARQEEGHQPVRRRAPLPHPYWSEAP